MNDWDDIWFFLTVARTGSLSAAAKTLNVNHSTVSRRIKALEDRFGVRLFDQLSSGYKITEDAAEVYEIALHIEELNQGFERKLQGLDSRLSGPVTVTMPHDIFEFFFANYLPEFLSEYPDIEIDIHVAKGLKDLAAREADIAVRLTNNPPDYLIGKRICDVHYGIYQQDDLSLNSDGTTPIIAWSHEQSSPIWATEQFSMPKTVLKADDLLAMYKAVQAGIGVARMPVYMHNIAKVQTIKVLPVPVPRSDWGVWVLSHRDLRSTLRVQKLRSFILDKLIEGSSLFTEH